MVIRSVRLPVLALALVALALGGCKRGEESAPAASAPPPVSSPGVFRVKSVDVGKAIDEGKRIAAPAAEFEPSDTIFASIATDGAAPKVTLVARWTYEDGQVVSEDTQVIAPNGPAATEFHIAKGSGFPEGKYRVEITANGMPAGSRDFEVK